MNEIRHIAILGVGKLGLCFALNLERVGFHVTGVDIDPEYIDALNAKTFRSHEPQVEEMLKKAKNFNATLDTEEAIRDATVIFIAVATPSTPEGGYDHYQIERVVSKLQTFGPQPGRRHIAIVCTTMPGYCDTVAPRLNPLNYSVNYNPEFIAQGSIIHDQQYPDQVLIGEEDEEAGDVIASIYEKMTVNEPVICRMSRLSAEICKLATNCFLTMKISFANAIGDLATMAGAEPDKILHAIGADSRIGHKYLHYGFGYGGPCLPRDNRALNLFANRLGYDLLLGKASDEVNKRHLDFMVKQWLKNHPGEEVVIQSVTYKPGTVIIEESQQLAFAVKLAERGKKVIIEENPEVIKAVKNIYGDLFTYRIKKDTAVKQVK